jgi:hypothetical protein
MIVRRPATFVRNCTYAPSADEPATLAGVEVLCGIETSDKQYHPIEVTVSGDDIHFTLRAETANWSLGDAQMDIRFSTNGLVWFTQIIEVEVQRTITRPTP